LEQLIQCEQDRLDELRDQAGLHSPGLSDMPKAPGAKDKLGELVPKIVDQEAEIQANIKKYSDTRERILRFINHIQNPRIKLIIIKRFINQQSWPDIANDIGGKETEYTVKQCVYRYLEMDN
jgi:hypothetical protein